MILGYARTSTVEQVAGFEAQERDLRAAGAERIFAEQVSSVAPRAKLAEVIDFAREGDVIVVTKLDRLGRIAMDVRSSVERLAGLGVRVHCLALGGTDLTLTVDLIEPLGSETLLNGRIAALAGDPVVVKLTGHAPVEWQGDERIGIGIDPAYLHVFDAETGRRVEPVIR